MHYFRQDARYGIDKRWNQRGEPDRSLVYIVSLNSSKCPIKPLRIIPPPAASLDSSPTSLRKGATMAAVPYVPSYRNVSVSPDGLGTFNINYIEAGSSSAPTILLLHGFPSSSTQYRDLIPMLSGKYHVLAPDFPAYGLTESPSGLAYTFDNLAAAISAWLVALNIVSYAMVRY
jgi:hypothetical protein